MSKEERRQEGLSSIAMAGLQYFSLLRSWNFRYEYSLRRVVLYGLVIGRVVEQ
jgi:hypothetical protein